MNKIRLCLFAILTCGLIQSLGAASPSFYFSGAIYELASVDVAKDGSITNEYVPQGQNLTSWTSLIGVRYWPRITKVSKAADGWVGAVRNVMIRNAVSYAAP